MDFAYASEYTCGKNLLIVANENGGTVAVYAVENEQKTCEIHSTFHAAEAEGPDKEQISSTRLIYSVHGSGGNTVGTVSHDCIVIKNISDGEINLTGYRAGYSSGGSAWQEPALSGTIKAGEINLIRLKTQLKMERLPQKEAAVSFFAMRIIFGMILTTKELGYKNPSSFVLHA